MNRVKYTIVTLIKGEAEQYQQELLYSVAKKFNIKGAIEKRPPAHITLKYSFLTDNIAPVEDAIEEFAKTHKKSSYRLYGFGSFDRDVIFLDVIPSKEMMDIYNEFINHLKSRLDIEFKQFDGNTHFHSSIAHTDIEDKFDDIMSFVSGMMPNFDLVFDNICILKIVEGVWRVHKTYIFS